MHTSSYSFNFGALLLRLVVGLSLLFHGYAKLNFGTSFIENILASKGLPEVLVYGVYIGEILAPLLLIIGYQTRLAAFVIIINIIFAIVLVHPDDILALTQHGGMVLELHYFYIITCLAITMFGSGKFGIDRS